MIFIFVAMGNVFIKPFLVVSQLMRSCSLGGGFGKGTPPPPRHVGQRKGAGSLRAESPLQKETP